MDLSTKTQATRPAQPVSLLNRATAPRRALPLLVLALALTGCAQAPQVAGSDRSQCFRSQQLQACEPEPTNTADRTPACFRSLRLSTCVTAPGATPEQASQVRRLASRTDSGRIVVVRGQWGDLRGVAEPLLGGEPLQQMIPYSAFAVDVPAGRHQLSTGTDSTAATVDVAAGSVVAVELRRRLNTQDAYDIVPLGRQEAQTLMQGIRVLGLFDRTAPAAGGPHL